MTPLVPPAQNARPSSALGARETSGVQVRLAPRRSDDRDRSRRRGRRASGPAVLSQAPRPGAPHGPHPGASRGRRPAERRSSGRGRTFVLAGLLSGIVAAAVVAAVIVLLPRATSVQAPEPQAVGKTTAAGPGAASGAKSRMPRTGAPVEISTADGSRYRIAAVTAGIDGGAGAASQGSSLQAARTPTAYLDFVLSNPSKRQVLLDYPGDVFVRRDAVAPEARGRCMWQAGVPETMCTPPTRSRVVRTLAGGRLLPGDGGDRYMPPRSSYLVRVTVDVPVTSGIKRSDLRLYIWKQLYMADRPAQEAPLPR